MTPGAVGQRSLESAPPPRRVVVADDQPEVLAALRELLDAVPQLEVVALAGSAREVVEACREHDPDVVVLDVHMPGSGLEAARRVRQLCRGARIVVLTAHDTPAVRAAAIAAGADAFVGKAGDDVVAAVLGAGDAPAVRG